MKEIVNEILDSLKLPQDEYLILPGSGRVRLDRDFKVIPQANDVSIMFVDGGNQEIISAPNFSLHFIRIFLTVYHNKKRIKTKKIEFFALSKLLKDKVEVKTFNLDFPLKNSIFDVDDLSNTINLFRRLCEIKFAEMNDLADVVVLDGSLTSQTDQEKKFIDALIETGKTICGVSKTSTMMTENKTPISLALKRKTELKTWYYTFQDKNSGVSVAKLHPDSKYCFVVEASKDLSETIALLAYYSKDAVFPGYPYGLIEADRFARVSNKERELLRIKLFSEAGKSKGDIKNAETALDAHSVLDNIL
jgi:hypothetical protein